MLDSHLHPRLKPLLNAAAGALDRPGISPDGLTLLGFAIGALALPFLALGWYGAALAAILLNRLLDGLDGALARRRGLSDAGGFLDISLDFLFYALVPFGFILAEPQNNALAGGWLLFAFIGTGSSFLAFAALAAKHQIANPGYAHKSLHYLGGADGGDGDYPAVCPQLLVSGAFRLAGVAVWRAMLADDGDAYRQRLPDLKAGGVSGKSRVAGRGRRARVGRVTGCFPGRVLRGRPDCAGCCSIRTSRRHRRRRAASPWPGHT
ncbi:phosphatidylglycerophosphate synthase [Klebsiella quasipneumoniae]|nr:phosphatidylglycerophosphate synthase [Klebsiella quasipneumoniae]